MSVISKTIIGHLLNRLTQTRSMQTVVSFEEINPTKTYKHTAFILHGLLGSSRNWRSFARSLLSSLPNQSFRLILIDLRNHGNSAFLRQLTPPHNIQNAANDLTKLIQSQNWTAPDVVIGHSLGGKVALQFAKTCPLKQVWVLDSVPGKVVSSREGEVERVLRTLSSIRGKIESRKWLVEYMKEKGFSGSLSEWIGSNLDGEMKWGFNLDGAVEMFESYKEMDYWELLERGRDGMEINVVRAEKSDRWDDGVVKELQRVENLSGAKVKVHLLRNAGHWVHVDNPKGLIQILAPGMAECSMSNIR